MHCDLGRRPRSACGAGNCVTVCELVIFTDPAPVPPEYSIERLTCVIASGLDAVMVG
jgi:hypothetical protein